MPEPLVTSHPGDAGGSAEADPLGPTVMLPAAVRVPAPGQTPPAAPPPFAPAPAAGWFGKLPFLGDFASRRLPERFITQWDGWLQPGLAESKQASADHWLDLYLTFPVWRFLIPGGTIDEDCWIGVLLPSVDRVGRCFPLTICEALSRRTLEEAGLIRIETRLAAIADVGIKALDAETIDFLEQELAGLEPLTPASAATTAAPPQRIPLEVWLHRPPAADAGAGAWPLNGTLAAALAAAASRFVVAGLGDRVLWWSPADETGAGGALLLEPYPFSPRLLARLIGAVA